MNTRSLLTVFLLILGNFVITAHLDAQSSADRYQQLCSEGAKTLVEQHYTGIGQACVAQAKPLAFAAILQQPDTVIEQSIAFIQIDFKDKKTQYALMYFYRVPYNSVDAEWKTQWLPDKAYDGSIVHTFWRFCSNQVKKEAIIDFIRETGSTKLVKQPDLFLAHNFFMENWKNLTSEELSKLDMASIGWE